MSGEDYKRLKAQQDANSAAIARMQMMLQAQHQNAQMQYEDDFEEQPPAPPAQHQGQAPYQQMDPGVMMMQAMTQQAAKQAADQVTQNLTSQGQAQTAVKARMDRLVKEYPALTQEDSILVAKARDAYARIKVENPGLDEATRYELAVREAASLLGARPVNVPAEEIADWTMPSGSFNPSVPTKSTKSRLTPNIIKNAQLMGINIDPKTPEGKQNLAELSEYSARFNADQDETAYRYR